MAKASPKSPAAAKPTILAITTGSGCCSIARGHGGRTSASLRGCTSPNYSSYRDCKASRSTQPKGRTMLTHVQVAEKNHPGRKTDHAAETIVSFAPLPSWNEPSSRLWSQSRRGLNRWPHEVKWDGYRICVIFTPARPQCAHGAGMIGATSLSRSLPQLPCLPQRRHQR
jgi:hypothetical protein